MPVSVLTGNPDDVLLGPGVLFCAPLGTSEPATIAALTGASAWREVGWTDDGSVFSQTTEAPGIEVEEEFYPVKYATTTVTCTLAFAMKQVNRKNLALAMNAGANAANDATVFEPVTPGNEVRIMLALVSQDDALWIFRRCFQTGSVEMNFQKAPDARLIPVTWGIEKPTGLQPWEVTPNASGRL